MTEENAVPAGWNPDPDDPHLMRWWNGSQWGEDRKPRAILAAEDHTRILTEQTRLLAEMRNDVAAIKSIATFWLVLFFLGLIGGIAVAALRG